MSDDKWPSDQEIEDTYRMARETSDFFAGLATTLRPQEGQTLSDKSQAAETVEPIK